MKNHVIKTLMTVAVTAMLITGMTACGSSGAADTPDGGTESVPDAGSEVTDTGKSVEGSEQSPFDAVPVQTQDADDQTISETDADKPAPEIAIYTKYYYEMTDDGNYTQLLSGHLETPVLTDESAKLYPKLAREMQLDADDEISFFDSEVEGCTKEAQETLDAMGLENFSGKFEITQYVNIMRADQQVVSVLFPVTEFTGGAHGIYGNGATNYDSQTGAKLELRDVVTNPDNLPAIVRSELEQHYADLVDSFYGLEESLSHYVPYSLEKSDDETASDDSQVSYTWALTRQGLELYFGPYELGPYAIGDQYVVLKYSDYPDLIKPEYTPEDTDASFMEYFGSYTTLYDLNGDGNGDVISMYPVSGEKEDDPEYIDLELTVGDQTVRVAEDEYGIPFPEDAKGYYIHMKDGRDYLYLLVATYSDYYELHVYDVTGGQLKKCGVTYFPSFGIDYDEKKDIMRSFVMYDPENIRIATRFDFISTFSGFKSYHVGSDGMPVSDDKEFVVYTTGGWEPVTCIKDFKAQMVNEDGSTQNITVNKGETFTFVATDGETYLDTLISDGTRIRLDIDGSGSDLYVCGEPAEELFKELMYSG